MKFLTVVPPDPSLVWASEHPVAAFFIGVAILAALIPIGSVLFGSSR